MWPVVTTGIGVVAGPSGADELKASSPTRTQGPTHDVRLGPTLPARWSIEALDRTTLPALFEEVGFSPPVGLKALVVRVVRAKDGPTYLFYDFSGTSLDRDDWWPASTVKVFAAVAALERLRGWGFSPSATVTFHDNKQDVERSVEWLVRQAITHSDNAAFDMLVEVVGGDEMNQWLREKGFLHTVLLRGYSRRHVDPKTKRGILRVSVPITIREPGRPTRHLPTRHGRFRSGCRDQGNCTTLWDLADCLRRVMLHEDLAEAERFALGREEVQLLQSALSAPRERGLGVVSGIKAAFPEGGVTCYHKPGFALDWFSDHVFVRVGGAECPDAEWLVAMAAPGGRDALDEAARVVGRLLASGRFGPRPRLAPSPASGRCGRSGRRPRWGP